MYNHIKDSGYWPWNFKLQLMLHVIEYPDMPQPSSPEFSFISGPSELERIQLATLGLVGTLLVDHELGRAVHYDEPAVSVTTRRRTLTPHFEIGDYIKHSVLPRTIEHESEPQLIEHGYAFVELKETKGVRESGVIFRAYFVSAHAPGYLPRLDEQQFIMQEDHNIKSFMIWWLSQFTSGNRHENGFFAIKPPALPIEDERSGGKLSAVVSPDQQLKFWHNLHDRLLKAIQ